MVINSLDGFRKSISRSIILSFLVIAFFSVFILLVIYLEFQTHIQESDKKQLENTIALYQSHLSEKLSIVANSTIFVDFLRSGKETRKILLPDLLYELTNINFNYFNGMKIFTTDKELLFEEGKTSDHSLILSLCYLNGALDKIGECNYVWELFISEEKILQQLQRINSNIESCSNCSPIDFLKSNKLGSFSAKENTPFSLYIKIKEGNQSLIYFYPLFIFLILILFTIWNRYRIKHIVNYYIANPIENIAKTVSANQPIDTSKPYIHEISYLVHQLSSWRLLIKKAEDQKHEAAIGRLTSQVVHDIRSPLSALDIAIKENTSIPDVEKLLIRKAVSRIHDIANNLLSRYKQKDVNMVENCSKPALIADVFHNVISEKRIQLHDTNIETIVQFEDETFGLFAKIIASEFERAISNLIDNAIEAITQQGQVFLTLKESNKFLILCINDNGCGIPEDILPAILNGNLSLKKNGAGLGLSRAKNLFEQWNCKFILQSKMGTGTSISIHLPITPPPNWFASEINIMPNSTVVILDDDESMPSAWLKRLTPFMDTAQVKLVYFKECSQFIEWCHTYNSEDIIYLIDYEFQFGKNESDGLKIIEMLKIEKQSYLITSHFENIKVQQRAIQLEITIVPKRCLPYIPIKIQNIC